MSLLVDKFSLKYYPTLCVTPNSVMGFLIGKGQFSFRNRVLWMITNYNKVNAVD